MQREKAERKQVIIETLFCIRSHIHPALTERPFHFLAFVMKKQNMQSDKAMMGLGPICKAPIKQSDKEKHRRQSCVDVNVLKQEDEDGHLTPFSCLGSSLCMQEAPAEDPLF